VAETDLTDKAQPVPQEAESPGEVRPDGVELTDERLDEVSGGVKTRHETAKNSISNVR
jgi:hypothetical protein